MKKICMIAYTYYIYDPRVKREAEALAERGDHIDVICLKEIDSKQEQIINNVHIIRVNMGKYRGDKPVVYLLSYLKFFFLAFFKVTCIHFKNHYEIIFTHTMPDFLVFSALIPRLFGAKIILDIHDLMPELYISKFNLKKNHYLIRFITFIEKCCVAFSHQAIAVHATHLQALTNHGHNAAKLNVLLNLPDPKVFVMKSISEKSTHAKTVFLYHGTISKRHGLEVAIRALQLIYRDAPHILLKIIGDGDDLSRLIKLTEDLKLNDYVYFNRTFVMVEDVVQQIHSADIGIVPILLDCFTHYMLPTKLLEYVALDLPVICTRTDTVNTYFDDSMVYFFNSGNVEELALCMKDLYFDINKRSKFTVNANSFNRMYNWNMQKKLLYQIVDKLTDS